MEADGSFRVHRTAASGEATGCAFCLLWKMEVIPVQVGQAEMSARQWTLELRAPVTVVSALPVPFTVEVTGATDEPLTETLQPQKKREIYSCPAEMLELCVSLYDPQLWSKKVTLRPTEGDATETKVPLAVPTGSSGSMGKSELMVSIVTSWPTASKPVVIFVHSPAWIADHVRSEHLRFIYPRKERSASMISVGRVWDHNSALRCVPLPPCDDAASDATEPRMLPLDCDAKSVGFRLQQTELSQEFKVEALGHTVVRLSADKGAESKDDEPDFMLLGVTTTVQFTERIGDLIYEVRVLHVAPAQVAINATGRPLCLRQARSPRYHSGSACATRTKRIGAGLGSFP
ncbi:unnamed protein product [Symbiodinium sp. CCMP2592]|nr:unnamed protein product [Symbiodinium sp. CCMP2592]